MEGRGHAQHLWSAVARHRLGMGAERGRRFAARTVGTNGAGPGPIALRRYILHGFSRGGMSSSLTRATRWYGAAPAREEARTTTAVVRATCFLASQFAMPGAVVRACHGIPVHYNHPRVAPARPLQIQLSVSHIFGWTQGVFQPQRGDRSPPQPSAHRR